MYVDLTYYLIFLEIARRIAKISGAPFIKAEATKFTEVGFQGRDVDQMVKDLVSVGISEAKKELREEYSAQVYIIWNYNDFFILFFFIFNDF